MTDTTTPLTPFIHAAHQVTDLEDWGALEEATGPAMTTSGSTLWTGEGDQEVGHLGVHPRAVPVAARDP